MAENFELPFYEVSCKDNINIESVFLTLARRIRDKREQKVRFFLILNFSLELNIFFFLRRIHSKNLIKTKINSSMRKMTTIRNLVRLVKKKLFNSINF